MPIERAYSNSRGPAMRICEAASGDGVRTAAAMKMMTTE
jgi:hypothetical protein